MTDWKPAPTREVVKCDRTLLKEKMEDWETVPVEERLNRIGASIQELKDGPYEEDSYKCHFQYAVGEQTVVCWEGIYYLGKVKNVTSYECPDLKKQVPMYTVHFPWNYNEEVVEYDMHKYPTDVSMQEVLYAHYWNEAKLPKRADLKPRQRKAVFRLPPNSLEEMELSWRVALQNDGIMGNACFASWVGLKK